MTQAEFDACVLPRILIHLLHPSRLVQSIRESIADGVHPKMITKGSSGSYFARAKNELGRVHTVAFAISEEFISWSSYIFWQCIQTEG